MQAQFLPYIRPINLAYANQAKNLQWMGMHKIIRRWTKQENIQFESTRVLIVTAHGPREDLIEKKYFLDQFSKKGIVDAEKNTGHIICVEMLPEQIATVSQYSLIDFLKKHQLNKQIGLNMLGDPNAMMKDVLGGGDPSVLAKLCPFYSKTDRMHHSMFKSHYLEAKKEDGDNPTKKCT